MSKNFTMEWDRNEHKFTQNDELRSLISQLTRDPGTYVNIKDLVNSFLDMDATARYGKWNLLQILRQIERVEVKRLE